MVEAIKAYLSEPILSDIDALVLGCTHYPLIKELIQKFHPAKSVILDSTDIVAKLVKKLLSSHELLSNNAFEPEKKFYVSDYTAAFSAQAKLFFKGPVSLERYPLWE